MSLLSPRLEMRNITKHFGATVALERVSLEVASGEVHALVGENGAGKSTLMKILSGAVAPDAGTIALRGAPLHLRNVAEARRAGIAMVYQELNLVPDLTVAENLSLGRLPTLVRFSHLAERARSLLDQVGLSVAPDRVVRWLGAGEQQLVAVARAFAHNAQVLILDEPTATLSAAEVRQLFALIDKVRREGVAVVYISHRLEEIFQIANRVSVLRDGERVATAAAAELEPREIVRLMVGRE